MNTYKAPYREIRFVLHELLGIEAHYRSLGRDEVDGELIDSILRESGRFAEQVVAPLNSVADHSPSKFSDGRVTTPPGFREAYQRYQEDGWATLIAPDADGNEGLPRSLEFPMCEMLSAASLSWRNFSGLSTAATMLLEAHADADLKSRYFAHVASGEWLPTMCLTEPQCGSDLSLLRTRAKPLDDGSYEITGTKIFISGGEQDLTPNIVHLVLARLPDAPAGPRGISLFLVPKLLDMEHPNEINGVRCISIEHKMGLRGSATCSLEFNNSKGWLIGAPNGGLACMFTMMNHARLTVALQGVGLADLAFQRSRDYALERRQGRAPGMSQTEQSDLIIMHPDVRRMLMTQRSLTEGMRTLAYFIALQLDIAHAGSDEQQRRDASDLVALLTPIGKAFMTDAAVEAASLAIQIHGGHGYISEVGVEQILRDARITPIYEGTNGIQAADLLGRKVLGNQRAAFERLLATIATDAAAAAQRDARMERFANALSATLNEWRSLTEFLNTKTQEHPCEMGAAAVDYLMFSGYACVAWCWLRMADTAYAALDSAPENAFYLAKLDCADFYFQRLLPRCLAHDAAARAGAQTLMRLTPEQWTED